MPLSQTAHWKIDLLGGFQIDEGQDHLAWLESLALYSEVDFMLNDENTILIDIFIDI